MQVYGPISDDAMVTVFLRAELDSSRFGHRIDRIVPADDPRRRWLSDPDLTDQQQNRFRAGVLGVTRGWRVAPPDSDRCLARLPADTVWVRVTLERDELLDGTVFFGGPPWTTDTAGTRSPRRWQELAPADSQLRVLAAAILPSVLAGTEPMIAVAERLDGPRVMLEGNGRLAAFSLSSLTHAEVIIGVSPTMADWRWW